jgi:hypothetical protein
MLKAGQRSQNQKQQRRMTLTTIQNGRNFAQLMNSATTLVANASETSERVRKKSTTLIIGKGRRAKRTLTNSIECVVGQRYGEYKTGGRRENKSSKFACTSTSAAITIFWVHSGWSWSGCGGLVTWHRAVKRGCGGAWGVHHIITIITMRCHHRDSASWWWWWWWLGDLTGGGGL